MNCSEAQQALVTRLSGELTPSGAASLAAHLEECPACRHEARAYEDAWSRLAEEPLPRPSADFLHDTRRELERETLRRRVVPFRSRPVLTWAARAAVLALAAAGGFLAAKSGRITPGVQVVPREKLPFLTERTVDVSRTVPDLSGQPRVANVAYRPADAAGKIGVSFDVTTRYTIVGRPDQDGIANVLAYLVTGSAGTEGTRARAIDLVSQHYGTETPPPSPQVVSALAATLKADKNPGVRKKAAEALAALPPTAEIRDALMAALKSDANPAVRIAAVEGLAHAATTLHDAATIETLREKATDQQETGYVRSKAATALKHLEL